MLIKTAKGWRPWSLAAVVITAGDSHNPPSEGRCFHFMRAKDRGDLARNLPHKLQDHKKEEKDSRSWLRRCFYALHRRAFPAGFHVKNSVCVMMDADHGCPFSWTPNYLSGN